MCEVLSVPNTSHAISTGHPLCVSVQGAGWEQQRHFPRSCSFNSSVPLTWAEQAGAVTGLWSCEGKETELEGRERQRWKHILPQPSLTAALKKIQIPRDCGCALIFRKARLFWVTTCLPCCVWCCWAAMLLLYTFLVSSLESIYRRGARRWRKLYRVNGHLFQAKRFNRVSTVAWNVGVCSYSVLIVCLSLCFFCVGVLERKEKQDACWCDVSGFAVLFES